MKEYSKEICNVIENEKMIRYEETSESYCKMVLSDLNKIKKGGGRRLSFYMMIVMI